MKITNSDPSWTYFDSKNDEKISEILKRLSRINVSKHHCNNVSSFQISSQTIALYEFIYRLYEIFVLLLNTKINKAFFVISISRFYYELSSLRFKRKLMLLIINMCKHFWCFLIGGKMRKFFNTLEYMNMKAARKYFIQITYALFGRNL